MDRLDREHRMALAKAEETLRIKLNIKDKEITIIKSELDKLDGHLRLEKEKTEEYKFLTDKQV